MLVDAESIAVRVTEERPSRFSSVYVGWVHCTTGFADRCDRFVQIINHDVDFEVALGRWLLARYEPAGDLTDGVVERQAAVAVGPEIPAEDQMEITSLVMWSEIFLDRNMSGS